MLDELGDHDSDRNDDHGGDACEVGPFLAECSLKSHDDHAAEAECDECCQNRDFDQIIARFDAFDEALYGDEKADTRDDEEQRLHDPHAPWLVFLLLGAAAPIGNHFATLADCFVPDTLYQDTDRYESCGDDEWPDPPRVYHDGESKKQEEPEGTGSPGKQTFQTPRYRFHDWPPWPWSIHVPAKGPTPVTRLNRRLPECEFNAHLSLCSTYLQSTCPSGAGRKWSQKPRATTRAAGSRGQTRG